MTFQQDANETPVLFRVDRSGDFKGNVTAVFPCEPYDRQGYQMSCYAHVGQHGGCSFDWLHETRPAKPEEYADLKRELESAPYGYRLKICKRISSHMHDARRSAVRKTA